MHLHKLETKLSRRILQTYREWALHEETQKSGTGEIIAIDDLATHKTPRQMKNRFQIENDFLEILVESGIDSPEVLKIRNSIAFLKGIDREPSLESIRDAGTEIIDVSDSYLEKLTEKISRLEKSIGVLNLKSAMDRSDFLIWNQAIIDSGFDFLASQTARLRPIDISLVESDGSPDFAAKVKTDDSGSLLCVMPNPTLPSPAFTLLMIHEVLGHALHFCQLRQNTVLQENQPHLLCLSIHTHENFLLEAVAQLITTRLLFSGWSVPNKDVLQLYDLKELRVRASIHKIMPKLLTSEITLDVAAQMHQDLCPGALTLEILKKRYASLMSSTFNAKALTNYFSAFAAVEPLLSLPDKDFFFLLPSLLSEYFTPETLKNFVKTACAEKS